MKTEKRMVLDTDGYPKEIRYYEDGLLIARMGVILDANNKFIGLEELDVTEVMPISWMERLQKLRKKRPETHIDITTVDFIGLINWIDTINTIKTINTITNIETIKNIENIENIETIGNLDSLKTITDGTIREQQLLNASFERANFDYWQHVGATSIETDAYGIAPDAYCCKFVYSGAFIFQLTPPLTANKLTLCLFLKSDQIIKSLYVQFAFFDGTTEVWNPIPTLPNTWTPKVYQPTTAKLLQELQIGLFDNVTYYLDLLKLIRT